MKKNQVRKEMSSLSALVKSTSLFREKKKKEPDKFFFTCRSPSSSSSLPVYIVFTCCHKQMKTLKRKVLRCVERSPLLNDNGKHTRGRENEKTTRVGILEV